jgi:hypothetical protein
MALQAKFLRFIANAMFILIALALPCRSDEYAFSPEQLAVLRGLQGQLGAATKCSIQSSPLNIRTKATVQQQPASTRSIAE